MRTAEGLDLAAWYVPSRNGAAVLSYPTRRRLPQARMLVRHGYGVLLLDARGYDGSEGDPNLLGWEGAKDIDAAVAWLGRRPDVTEGRIGGIGFSVGGETMLEAAASNTGLRAVVSEGAGTRSVQGRAPRASGLSRCRSPPCRRPRWPSRAARRHPARRPGAAHRATANVPDLRRARRRRRGAERRVLPCRLCPEGSVEDRRGGARGWARRRPQEYERRVTGFFDRALLGE